jgi:hypothetical protein
MRTHRNRTWMNTPMKLPRLLICVLSLGGVLLSGAASAQADRSSPGAQSRAPVLLALVDSLPDTVPRFRLIRLPGESTREAVLLPSDATPELLTQALETLRMVWVHDEGSQPGEMLRLKGGTAETHRRRAFPWAGRVLHDLHEAQPRQIPGVGSVRAVQIWLTPLPAAAAGRPQ